MPDPSATIPHVSALASMASPPHPICSGHGHTSSSPAFYSSSPPASPTSPSTISVEHSVHTVAMLSPQTPTPHNYFTRGTRAAINHSSPEYQPSTPPLQPKVALPGGTPPKPRTRTTSRVSKGAAREGVTHAAKPPQATIHCTQQPHECRTDPSTASKQLYAPATLQSIHQMPLRDSTLPILVRPSQHQVCHPPLEA